MMRVGQLKDVVSLIDSDGVDQGSKMVGIDDKDSEIPFDTKLKTDGKIVIRSRYSPELMRGKYLKARDGRLFYLVSVNDPDRKKKDLVCHAVELVGAPAVLDLPKPKTVRCALTAYKQKAESEHGFLPAEERRQAEFANVEWRPQVGVEFALAGAVHRIIEIDANSSDSVVTRVWVEFIEYENE